MTSSHMAVVAKAAASMLHGSHEASSEILGAANGASTPLPSSTRHVRRGNRWRPDRQGHQADLRTDFGSPDERELKVRDAYVEK
jgi:hypothetical protein